jgi:release factor glutamine methyltransferase
VPGSVVERLRAAGCVFAEDEAELLVGAGGDLEALVARRVTGEPLEQVLGWAEFCGLRVPVEPGVFVPRRRTGLLVREAVALDPRVVLDLCCGTGAVGLAVVTALGASVELHPSVELHCADVDPAAVACARRAVAGVGGRVHLGDLDEPLPADLRGRVDVLVVNAPYVPTGAVALMPPEARVHEHRVALDGGVDGLDLHRRVAAVAPRWVRPGGSVLVETSERQAPATAELLRRNGFRTRIVRDDELDATVAVGILRPRE